MVKVSAIVPVYNSEDTVEATVKSIINQTITDIEVLLVNDGSTDNTLQVCKKMEAVDNRIKIINKENGGVSSARNTGLKIARGDYIGFVDADDWIEPNMFESMYSDMLSKNADIAMSNFYNGKNKVHLDIERSVLHNNDIFNLIVKNIISPVEDSTSVIMGNVWRCLFTKDIIKDIYFIEELPYMEDQLFVLEALLNANIVIINQSYFYHYNVNYSSAMRNYKDNFYSLGKLYFEKLLLLLTKYDSRMKVEENLRKRYLILILSFIRNEVHIDNPYNFLQRIRNIKQICNDKLLKNYLDDVSRLNLKLQQKISFNLISKNNYLILYFFQKILEKLVYIKSIN